MVAGSIQLEAAATDLETRLGQSFTPGIRSVISSLERHWTYKPVSSRFGLEQAVFPSNYPGQTIRDILPTLITLDPQELSTVGSKCRYVREVWRLHDQLVVRPRTTPQHKPLKGTETQISLSIVLANIRTIQIPVTVNNFNANALRFPRDSRSSVVYGAGPSANVPELTVNLPAEVGLEFHDYHSRLIDAFQLNGDVFALSEAADRLFALGFFQFANSEGLELGNPQKSATTYYRSQRLASFPFRFKPYEAHSRGLPDHSSQPDLSIADQSELERFLVFSMCARKGFELLFQSYKPSAGAEEVDSMNQMADSVQAALFMDLLAHQFPLLQGRPLELFGLKDRDDLIPFMRAEKIRVAEILEKSVERILETITHKESAVPAHEFPKLGRSIEIWKGALDHFSELEAYAVGRSLDQPTQTDTVELEVSIPARYTTAQFSNGGLIVRDTQVQPTTMNTVREQVNGATVVRHGADGPAAFPNCLIPLQALNISRGARAAGACILADTASRIQTWVEFKGLEQDTDRLHRYVEQGHTLQVLDVDLGMEDPIYGFGVPYSTVSFFANASQPIIRPLAEYDQQLLDTLGLVTPEIGVFAFEEETTEATAPPVEEAEVDTVFFVEKYLNQRRLWKRSVAFSMMKAAGLTLDGDQARNTTTGQSIKIPRGALGTDGMLNFTLKKVLQIGDYDALLAWISTKGN